jgi:hypothetical protein
MKNTIIIEKIQDSDRVIILHLTDGAVKGINYFQGIDAADQFIPHFLTADADLTNYVANVWNTTEFADHYEEMQWILPSPDYTKIIECIDKLIWDYVHLHREIEDMKKRLVCLQNDVKMLKSKIDVAEKNMSVYKSK